MKKSMQKQYGKEEGKKVYFATIRKAGMEGVAAIPATEIEVKGHPCCITRYKNASIYEKDIKEGI